jgi:DNA-binding NarL/FixJ family response regulator
MANNAKIVELRRTGKSFREIADEVGLSKERVRQILDAEGDPWTARARKRSISSRRTTVIRLFHKGLSQEAIAEELGLRSRSYVGRVLREEGLSRETKRKAWLLSLDADILAMRKQGLSFKTIAERLDLKNPMLVSQSLARQGVIWRSPIDRDEVVRLRHEGLTPKEISEQLGASRRQVLYALQQANLAQRRGKRT